MSIDFLNIAFKAPIYPSAMKFVLVALADYANESGEAYPSIETLENKTSLNRKTIIGHINAMIDLGILESTGERKGKTKQIPVYAIKRDGILSYKPPQKKPRGKTKSPKIGGVKEGEDSNSPKNGTVPILDDNSPKIGGVKESQNWDTEPSVLFNHQEPSDSQPQKATAAKGEPLQGELMPPAAQPDDEQPAQKTMKGKDVARAAWSNYSEAYENRYGVAPIQNAKVNSQMTQIVKRIGIDSIQVAGWFPTHNNSFYVKKGHVLGCLLADCEQLRTQWATNQQTTEASARRVDRTQTNYSAAEEAKRMLREKRQQGAA